MSETESRLYTVPEGVPAPAFEAEGQVLLRRLTMIVEGGRIEKVFYPVFPPDKNAQEVMDWLSRKN